jgi:DNA-directed RNA polymerase subunit N (RpoN/RPB10)
MVELVKATVQEKRQVNIHNDLSNAAFYFKNIIVEKQKSGGAGIGLDCMACATMLAFTWEAYLNFFGNELFKAEWQERQDSDTKTKLVLEKLGIKPDWSRRPYQSITTLMKLRDVFAHGEHEVSVEDKEVTGKAEKISNKKVNLSGDWERLCTPELIVRAHGDLDAVFKEILERSGMSLFDTLSRSEGGISFVEKVEVGRK